MEAGVAIPQDRRRFVYHFGALYGLALAVRLWFVAGYS